MALRAEQDGSSLNQLVTVLLTHALAVDDRSGQAHTQQGVEKVVEALRNWAYQNGEVRERPAWEKQVRRLRALGAQSAGEAEQLIEFANAHAGWGPTDPDILSEPWTDDLADPIEEKMVRIMRPETRGDHDNL